MRLRRSEFGVVVELEDGSDLPIRQILGIGRNYAEHARELGNSAPERPMVFHKCAASAVVSGESIRIPALCRDPETGGEQVDFEAELGVVIGRSGRDIAERDALSHVLGYCCCNDVSARWWQKHGSGGQFCRGKSFDTFCPVGPEVVPADRVGDPQTLGIRCRVNGVTMQDSSTSKMVHSVASLISELSRGTTLVAGSLILTGTPEGVGAGRTPPVFLRAGDVVEVEIDGLGVLRNPVEEI